MCHDNDNSKPVPRTLAKDLWACTFDIYKLKCPIKIDIYPE